MDRHRRENAQPEPHYGVTPKMKKPRCPPHPASCGGSGHSWPGFVDNRAGGVDGAFVALIAWFGAFFSYRYGPSFVKRGFHLWETRMTGWEELEISSLPFDFSGRRFTRASARAHMENSNFLFEISM